MDDERCAMRNRPAVCWNQRRGGVVRFCIRQRGGPSVIVGAVYPGFLCEFESEKRQTSKGRKEVELVTSQ